MPFPNLTLRSGGTLTAEATGTPDDGDNTFALAIPPAYVDENWLELDITLNGPSVTSATYVSLSGDKTQLTVNFGQTGADTVTLIATMIHSFRR